MSKNKLVIGIVVLLLVIIGGVGAYLIIKGQSDNSKVADSSSSSGNNSSSSSSSSDSSSSSSSFKKVDACNVLTQSVAESVLGNNLEHPSLTSSDTSTADVAISSCAYMTKPSSTSTSDGSLPTTNGVTLMVRSALSNTGAQSNKQAFSDYVTDSKVSASAAAAAPSTNTQKVTGIGDSAFYSQTLNQLNVLKGNNWYILTNYTGTTTNATLDSDKALAAKLNL